MNKPETPILVTKPFLPEKETFMNYVDGIWQRDWMTNQGPLHHQLEDELKSYLGVENLTLTVNGHLALEIAIRGLGLTGEVITTPFTFASTIHSIYMCGLKPVFCDIKPSDLTMDEEQIESLITEETSAILPVHVYGHPCNTAKIEEIARRHGLKVIYDAAHTFGVRLNGQTLSLQGDVSIYSFHATKLFHTIEGGALVYKDPGLKQVFDDYKNFGIHDEEHVAYVGGNAKMNEFQAAMGLCNLKHIDEIIAERREITLRYRKNLEGQAGITLFYPDRAPGVEYNYAYLPVLIDRDAFGISRDELHAALKANDNVVARKYFYPIGTEYDCYRELAAESRVPVAKAAGQSVLALPIYNGLSLEEVDYICECILNKKQS